MNTIEQVDQKKELPEEESPNIPDLNKSDNSSLSSDSSGGYEEAYSLFKPYKQSASKTLIKKIMMLIVFPA